jgi:hypothetical protein
MEDFAKNKTDNKQTTSKKEPITDVRLTKEHNNVVYDLIEETDNNTTVDASSLNEKIERLQHTQKSIALQLDDVVITVDKLTRQLKKEKQTRRASVTSYVALIMAGLALIIGLVVAFFVGSLQRDVNQLTAAVKQLEGLQTSSVDSQYIHAHRDDLALKIDSDLTKKEAIATTTVSANKLNNLADQSVDNKIVATPTPKFLTEATQLTSAPNQKSSLQNDAKLITAANQPSEKILTSKTSETLPITSKSQHSSGLSKKKSIINPPIKKNWNVSIGSYRNVHTATKNANQYRKAGIPTTIVKVNRQGYVWHRLLTKSLRSKYQATLYAEQVKRKLNIDSVLVIKRY